MSFLKKHYHWVVVSLVLLQLFVYGGLANTFTNIHVIPVSEALGITRTQFSLPISLKGLFGMLGSIASGFFLSRWGTKKTATFGMLLLTASYVVLAFFLRHYATLFLCCAVIGVSGGLCGNSVTTKVITEWFHKHRGLLMGIATSATTLGGSLLGIFQPMAMEKFGTYKASFALGVILLSIATVLIFLFLKNKPQDMGLAPYGEGEKIVEKKKRSAENVKVGLPFQTLLHRPSFYLMILCTILSCSTVYIASSIFVPHLMDGGLSMSQATGVNSYKHLLMSFAKLAIGALCDRIGVKKTVMVCLFFTSAGLVLFTMLGTNLPFAYFAATVMAIGAPVVMVIPPLMAFTLFGKTAQAQYTGIFLGMINLSSMLCSIVSNLVFDFVGSYSPAFFAVAVIGVLLMLVLYPTLFRLCREDDKSAEA